MKQTISRIAAKFAGLLNGGDLGFDLSAGRLYAGFGNRNKEIVLSDNARVDQLQFTGGTGDQGTVSWNPDEETLDVIQNGAVLQVGQELHVHCRNNTGATIGEGVVVMMTGTLGASGRITIAPMNGTVVTNAKFLLGVTTESITNGDDGKVTVFGKVRGIDTSAYSEGDVLWVSSSIAGAMTNVEPSGTSMGIPIAAVITSHAVTGTIMVRASSLDEHLYAPKASPIFTGTPTINGENLSPLSGFKNFLVNSDFSIVQRGYASVSNFAADCWLSSSVSGGADNVFEVVPVLSGSVDSDSLSNRIGSFIRFVSPASWTATQVNLYQSIYPLHVFSARQVTVSFYIRSTAALPSGSLVVTLGLIYGASATQYYSSTPSLASVGSEWVRVTATITLPDFAAKELNTLARLQYTFVLKPTIPSGAVVDITNVQLEMGGIPTNYETLPLNVQLGRVQHFVQDLHGTLVRATSVTSNEIIFAIPTSVKAPTGYNSLSFGIQNTDIVVRSISGVDQSGFSFVYFNPFAVTGTLVISAQKTGHGLSDAVLRIPNANKVILSRML